MKKERPLNMEKLGISFDRYKELYHFCQQYRRKKEEVDGLLTIKSSVLQSVKVQKGEKIEFAFLPRGTAGTSDPTAETAMRREKLLFDCRLLEDSAREADPELAPWIIKAVTTRDGVRRVNPPCCEKVFRNVRRRFFYILHLKKLDLEIHGYARHGRSRESESSGDREHDRAS